MKLATRLAILFAVVVCLGVIAQAQTKATPSADSIVNAALKTAQSENKTVWVDFGASWCGWCKKLDAMIESKEVGKLFADNYVIAHLTIQESADKKALENPGGEEMAAKAGISTGGVPVYFFLDKAGKQLATSMVMPGGNNIGHPATPEEIKAFDGLLIKTAPRMTAEQRAQISDYLSKQKN